MGGQRRAFPLKIDDVCAQNVKQRYNRLALRGRNAATRCEIGPLALLSSPRPHNHASTALLQAPSFLHSCALNSLLRRRSEAPAQTDKHLTRAFLHVHARARSALDPCCVPVFVVLNTFLRAPHPSRITQPNRNHCQEPGVTCTGGRRQLAGFH